MVRKIATALTFVCILPPVRADQSTQQKDIPPCAQSIDDPRHYPENMVRPKYPKDALRNGIAGEVVLRAVIAANSKTKDLVVLSGGSEFSQNAIVAIRKWRFHPELREGRPVETTYKIRVRFSPMLQEANSEIELESPLAEPPPSSSLAKRLPQDLGPEIHRVSEPGIIAPKQLYAPEPEFSEKARIEAQQGNVGIDLVVGTDGLPQALQIACSSAPDLNDNAIAAVRKWKFAPATKDGTPVPVEIHIEVSFTLGNNH
jgi:TonB family protein